MTTTGQNIYIAGLSSIVVAKTEGEGLAKKGAAISRLNEETAQSNLLMANNALGTMRIKNGMLNDKITRLATENSELRGLLEKRDEILGKIRAGIKAKIISSDALAKVLVNYGKKSGMTPEDMKKDVASATEVAREASESYSQKADGQLVKAGADEEVMAAVNKGQHIEIAKDGSPLCSPTVQGVALAASMLLEAKTAMEAAIAKKTPLDAVKMLQLVKLVIGALNLTPASNEGRLGREAAKNNGIKH